MVVFSLIQGRWIAEAVFDSLEQFNEFCLICVDLEGILLFLFS